MPFTFIKTMGAIIKSMNSPEEKAAAAAFEKVVETYNRLESQLQPGKGRDAFCKFMSESDFEHGSYSNEDKIEALKLMAADNSLHPELRKAAEDALAAEQAWLDAIEKRVEGLFDKDVNKEVRAADKANKAAAKQDKKDEKAAAKQEKKDARKS